KDECAFSVHVLLAWRRAVFRREGGDCLLKARIATESVSEEQQIASGEQGRRVHCGGDSLNSILASWSGALPILRRKGSQRGSEWILANRTRQIQPITNNYLAISGDTNNGTTSRCLGSLAPSETMES